MKKYVCVLSTDSYLNGVLVLATNLRALNSKYELLCLINEKISKASIEYLEYFNIEYKLLNKLNYKSVSEGFIWKNTFDKLNVFSLTEYEKVVYLDSDMLILENIDHLFNQPPITMTSNLPYAKESNNSCIMIIEPNKKDYEGLLNKMQEFDQRKRDKIGDQDIINAYFKDKVKILDESYNMMRFISKNKKQYYDVLTDNYIYKYEVIVTRRLATKPKVIHYILRPKPFNTNMPFEDEYYHIYKNYLDEVRIKKHQYKIDNIKLLVIIILLDKNKYFNTCLSTLYKQNHKNIEINILTYNNLDDYIISNNLNKNQILHNSKELQNKLKDYSYATFLYPNIIINNNNTYELALTKCYDYNLDWCQFNDEEANYLPYFLYLEKEDITKNKKQITDFLYDKIYNTKVLTKEYGIEKIIRNPKKAGIIGTNCYSNKK